MATGGSPDVSLWVSAPPAPPCWWGGGHQGAGSGDSGGCSFGAVTLSLTPDLRTRCIFPPPPVLPCVHAQALPTVGASQDSVAMSLLVRGTETVTGGSPGITSGATLPPPARLGLQHRGPPRCVVSGFPGGGSCGCEPLRSCHTDPDTQHCLLGPLCTHFPFTLPDPGFSFYSPPSVVRSPLQDPHPWPLLGGAPSSPSPQRRP